MYLGGVVGLLVVDKAETQRLVCGLVAHDDGGGNVAKWLEELGELTVGHVRGEILHTQVGVARARGRLALTTRDEPANL